MSDVFYNDAVAFSSTIGIKLFNATDEINLDTIAIAYKNPIKDMLSLDGKKYYKKEGDNVIEKTIECRVNKPFSLSELRGKYSNKPEVDYNGRASAARHSSAGRGGGGIEAITTLKDIKFTILNNKFTTVTFTAIFTSNNMGGSLGDRVEGVESTVNGKPVNNNGGTFTIDPNSNSVNIRSKCYARNNWPGGSSGLASIDVTLTLV